LHPLLPTPKRSANQKANPNLTGNQSSKYPPQLILNKSISNYWLLVTANDEGGGSRLREAKP